MGFNGIETNYLIESSSDSKEYNFLSPTKLIKMDSLNAEFSQKWSMILEKDEKGIQFSHIIINECKQPIFGQIRWFITKFQHFNQKWSNFNQKLIKIDKILHKICLILSKI